MLRNALTLPLQDEDRTRTSRTGKNKIFADLSNASSIAITTDGWTSRATESYVTVTAHYITAHSGDAKSGATDMPHCMKVTQAQI